MSIQRILVALDASSHSLAALEAAASLAARLHAELLGLFVEDVTLLNLAHLPFAKELGFPSAISRPLDADSVARMLRVVAAQARQAFAKAADPRGVRWSFRVARGSVVAEVVRAAAETDLLALGIAGRELTRRTRLGSTALHVLSHAPANVLLLQRGSQISTRALLVLDCSLQAIRCLPTALELATASGGGVTVLVLADRPDQAQQRLEEVTPTLAAKGLPARCQTMLLENLRRLPQKAQEERTGAVLFAAQSSFLEGPELQSLLQELTCPVFLIKHSIVR